MSDFSSALQKLETCKRSQNSKCLDTVFDELEVLTVSSNGWPTDFFEELVKLLEDGPFLELQDSWKLVYFISGNWDELSSEQRLELRPLLANAFDRFKDWMGAFVTAEVLGEHYPDQETLVILGRLAQTARIPARAAVPHALETVARSTQEDSLRGLAVRQLEELQASDYEQVRQEALISLKKLGH